MNRKAGPVLQGGQGPEVARDLHDVDQEVAPVPDPRVAPDQDPDHLPRRTGKIPDLDHVHARSRDPDPNRAPSHDQDQGQRLVLAVAPGNALGSIS